MVEVEALRGFISPVHGDVVPGRKFKTSRKMAEQMRDTGHVRIIETYETKVVVPTPLVSTPPAPSPSLPAAPAQPEPTQKKRGKKAKSSQSTTQ